MFVYNVNVTYNVIIYNDSHLIYYQLFLYILQKQLLRRLLLHVIYLFICKWKSESVSFQFHI